MASGKVSSTSSKSSALEAKVAELQAQLSALAKKCADLEKKCDDCCSRPAGGAVDTSEFVSKHEFTIFKGKVSKKVGLKR